MADITPPRRGEFLTSNGTPTRRFIEWIEAISGQSNTTDSDIDLFSSINPSTSALSSIDKKIKDLELLVNMSVFGGLPNFVVDYTIIGVTADHTTMGKEFLICTNVAPITITLQTNPSDGQDCIVARKDGKLTVSGAINGKTSVTISGKKSSIHFKYSLIAGEWTAT